jgi:hypothetical protein
MHRPNRVRCTPLDGGPEVGLILIEAARPKTLVLAVKPRGHSLAHVGEVGTVPGSDLFQLSRCHQLLKGKCFDGLQQPVAGSGGGALGLNQRLINQTGEKPGYLAPPDRRADAHLLRSTQRPSSSEDSKPAEQRLLRLAEQLMAPLNRGPKRLMPGGRADGATQQHEPVIEAVGNLPDTERGYPRGGQFQRQRDAI